jgi:hypothetical protein
VNNVKPKNPLLRIKYRFLEWRWDRILKKSGHHHWESYLRYNDPDFSVRGRTVRDQFSGYPYVAVVNYRHLDCNIDGMWGEIYNAFTVEAWCKQYCKGKYRWHWERVIVDHAGQYLPNSMGDTDELFFGFKLERDYLMFTLRWS